MLLLLAYGIFFAFEAVSVQPSPSFAAQASCKQTRVFFVTSRLVLVEHVGNSILCPRQAVHMHPLRHARFIACFVMQAAICAF